MAEQILIQSKIAKGRSFEATLPKQTITRSEAKNAFYELQRQLMSRKCHWMKLMLKFWQYVQKEIEILERSSNDVYPIM